MERWETMTREEIAQVAEADGVVVITIGATEQHGPHLPVMTDNLIMETIARASVEKARKSIPVIVGPHIPFGYSPHHFAYAGAISLSAQTLLQILKEVIDSVVRSDFKKIFILNSHGGNDEFIRLAAKEAHLEHEDLWIGAASYWQVAEGPLARYKDELEIYDVGHAGQFETSIIQAVAPSLVRIDQLEGQSSTRSDEVLAFPKYIQLKEESIWRKIDGYSDEPGKATAEIGEALIELIANAISDQLKDFYRPS